MSSNRVPTSYRAVRFILGLRLVSGIVVVAAGFWAASTEAGENPVRKGVIRSLGGDPAHFGAEDAGYVLGTFLLPMILVAMMLWAVSRGKLLGYRGLQVLDMLINLSIVPLAFLLGLTGLILSFRDAYVEYSDALRGDAPSIKVA